MARRGRKPLDFKDNEISHNVVKRNYYIEKRYAKALTVLNALTGKELSLLVNESIDCLIQKYQPDTEINLLNIKSITNIKG